MTETQHTKSQGITESLTEDRVAQIVESVVASAMAPKEQDPIEELQQSMQNVPTTTIASIRYQWRQGRIQSNVKALQRSIDEQTIAHQKFTSMVHAKRDSIEAVICSGLLDETQLKRMEIEYPDIVKAYRQSLERRDLRHTRDAAELRRDTAQFEAEINALSQNPSDKFRASLQQQTEENLIALEEGMKNAVSLKRASNAIEEELNASDFDEADKEDLLDQQRALLAQQYILTHGSERP